MGLTNVELPIFTVSVQLLMRVKSSHPLRGAEEMTENSCSLGAMSSPLDIANQEDVNTAGPLTGAVYRCGSILTIKQSRNRCEWSGTICMLARESGHWFVGVLKDVLLIHLHYDGSGQCASNYGLKEGLKCTRWPSDDWPKQASRQER